MTDCRKCGGRAELYLCWECAKQIRWLLVGKPVTIRLATEADYEEHPGIIWYLDKLTEAAYGQTRLQSSVRHTKHAAAILNLDDWAISDEMAQTSYKFFAQGGCNRAASKLRNTILDLLQVWCDQLPGDRTALGFTPSGADMARHLADHLTAVMAEENAHLLAADLLAHAKTATRIINRPPELYRGPCPALVTDKTTGEQTPCAVVLYAEPGEHYVTCRRCRTEHDADKLQMHLLSQIEDQLFTGPKLLTLLKALGQPINESTWKKVKPWIPPRGWQGDQPMYTYNDVREALARPGEPYQQTHRRRLRRREQAS